MVTERELVTRLTTAAWGGDLLTVNSSARVLSKLYLLLALVNVQLIVVQRNRITEDCSAKLASGESPDYSLLMYTMAVIHIIHVGI